MRGFSIFAMVLTAVFSMPLLDWVKLCVNSSLYSHGLLIPFISGYLVWLRKGAVAAIPIVRGQSPLPLVVAPVLVAAGLLTVYFIRVNQGWQPPVTDYLCLMMLVYLFCLGGGALYFLGPQLLGAILFPVLFLGFMAPFPVAVENGIEQFFQRWSADAAELFYRITGTTYLRTGQVFTLPGITIQVAQECSGVRSSLVLFITSLLAGQLFLKGNWNRLVFALFIIPLGIFRNAFRILTISLLCIHLDPNYIHSPIHHRGGPVFFVLSLIPFMLLLYLMRRWEQKRLMPAKSLRTANSEKREDNLTAEDTENTDKPLQR